MEWKLKKFLELSTAELYEILRLRAEVFVVEQNCIYNDLDRLDYQAHHLFLIKHSQIVAALRILPKNTRFEDISIGRVVVLKKYRHQGISREMMERAIEFITLKLNENRIMLSGQAHLTDYYESFGFKIASDVYIEDGINHYAFLFENDNDSFSH